MLKKIPKNMINLFLKNNLFSCQFFKKLFLFKSLTCFFIYFKFKFYFYSNSNKLFSITISKVS